MMKEDEERQAVQVGEAAPETMGQMVSRTMQDNITNVKQDIGGKANVVQIQGNAVDALNLQKVDAANDPTHHEQIDTTAAATNRALLHAGNAAANRALLQADKAAANRALLEAGNAEANRALLQTDNAAANRQALADDALSTHREGLSSQGLVDNWAAIDTNGLAKKNHGIATEIRIEHLSDDIQALHEQLTQFENQNKSWLNIGKLFQQAEEKNAQQLFADDVAPNSPTIEQEVLGKNLQTLEADEQGVNRQKINSNGNFNFVSWLSATDVHSKEDANTGIQTSTSSHVLDPANEHAHPEANANLKTPTPSFVSAVPVAQPASKRGHGLIHHQGRVLDWGQRRNPLGFKEVVLALSLMVCVSNLGATKPPAKSQEVRGVLLRLKVATDLQEPSSVLQVGP